MLWSRQASLFAFCQWSVTTNDPHEKKPRKSGRKGQVVLEHGSFLSWPYALKNTGRLLAPGVHSSGRESFPPLLNGSRFGPGRSLP